MDNSNDSFFQVSIKALFFNEDNKLMMIKEKSGAWEFPGGRMQIGEGFVESLKRESMEETGLECEVLETHPSIIYPAIDAKGRGRIMVFFKAKFNSTNFTPSDECVDIKFFTIEEIKSLPVNIQLKNFTYYISNII